MEFAGQTRRMRARASAVCVPLVESAARFVRLADRLRMHLVRDGCRRTWAIITAGIAGHVRARHTLLEDSFDATYGTDTAGVIPLWRISIPSPNASSGVQYATLAEADIRALLAPFPRDATFVDLGCGKGRVLCVAAMMGFAEVVGVEFAPALARVAEANLARLGLPATVLRVDAVDYQFPPGPLVVYLYNPFGAEITQRVSDALRTRGGECWVIYVNPCFARSFESWMDPETSSGPSHRSIPRSVAAFHHHGARGPEEKRLSCSQRRLAQGS